MMVGVADIVLALVVGYVLWVVVPGLWRYITICRLASNVHCRRPCHWFWGHMQVMDGSVSITKLTAETMKAKFTTKMIVGWVSWLPFIQAMHPDTAQVILKLSEPKPKGRGQTYSVFQTFVGDGLVISNGRKWERNRKLLTPAFHFEVLRPYVRIYNEAADKLLDKFAKQMKDNPKSIEITDALNLATLDVILRCSLSHEGNIQDSDKHPYATAVHRIGILTMHRVRIPWHFLSWTLYSMSANGKEYIKHVKYIHGFAEEIIAKRKQDLAEDPSLLTTKKKLDFLDILMTAKDENGAGLTDEEMRDEVDTFMFAGHETTLSALTWALYNLGKYPDEQEKLFREVCDVTGDRKYIEWEDLAKLQKVNMFLKENLRMYTPGGNTTRLLTKPLELDGQIYPAGATVGVSFMRIHYRPDIYPEPLEFRPERFLPENTEHRHPYAFLPFSAGPRNCIGQNFSMNEQKVMLSRIIKRVRLKCKIEMNKNHHIVNIQDIIKNQKSGQKDKTGKKRRHKKHHEPSQKAKFLRHYCRPLRDVTKENDVNLIVTSGVPDSRVTVPDRLDETGKSSTGRHMRFPCLGFKVVLDEDHEVRAVARLILTAHNGIRVRLEERCS